MRQNGDEAQPRDDDMSRDKQENAPQKHESSERLHQKALEFRESIFCLWSHGHWGSRRWHRRCNRWYPLNDQSST